MIRLCVALAFLACACSPFKPVVSGVPPYGEVAVYTFIDGPNIQHRLPDGMVVALDSAIQGYGLYPIVWSTDSARFQPVIPGEHDVTFRVSPGCSVVDGDTRVARVDTNRRTVITFEAHCGP